MVKDFSLPMSKDDVIEIEVGSAIYVCGVPIGETEHRILQIQGEAINIKAFMTESFKQIEEKSNGKKWGPGEKIAQVNNLAEELATKDFFENLDMAENREKTAQIFNVIVRGWRKKGDVKENVIGEDVEVMSATKAFVVEKYQDMMTLSEDESKN